MSAFPDSGRSVGSNIANMTVRFRPKADFEEPKDALAQVGVPFLALPSPPTDCLAVLYQLMLSRNRWLSADVSNSDRLLHSA